DNLARARTQIENYSAKELNSLRASLDPSKMNATLPGARAVLNDFKPALQVLKADADVRSKSGFVIYSAGLPPVDPPDAVCQALVGSGRPSSELIIATDAVYMTAKIVDVALNRG